MIARILNLSFKGNRDYLHGTDMYNSIVEIAARQNTPIAGHRLAIHAFARSQCELTMFASGEPLATPAHLVADFSFDTAPGRVTGFLSETGAEVKIRYPYEEERIDALCKTSGGQIRIGGDSGYSPIEVIVTMTKHLHNSALTQPSGKWVFTKLELSRALRADDAKQTAIVLLHNFNNRLTKSQILSGDEAIGHVYFSLWHA